MKKALVLSVVLIGISTLPLAAQRGPKTNFKHRERFPSSVTSPKNSLAINKVDTTITPEPTLVVLPTEAPPMPAIPVNPPMASLAPAIPIKESEIVRSYYVELPFNKTVSIIFPTAIKSVDLGSRDILADKAQDVENVLKIKAAKNGFNETNFSVITVDGKFWSFVANYNEQTPVLALNLTAQNSVGAAKSSAAPIKGKQERITYINGYDAKGGVIQFAGVNATQSEVVFACDEILRKRRNVRHLGVEANRMEADVRGVYIKDNVIYYKLAIQNKSNVNYDIDYVRFFIVDKTTAKRTSTQELEVTPLYIHNEAIKVVKGNTVVERVFAFQKFTIPDDKRIMIMTNEVNGGRALSFVVNNEDIMNADKL